ncbi:MAG: flagellar motor switch protein FliN [Candidatus Latescibacteria bacterium]|nr:flagellar motor switch protein FliN [Candidatus Latescibacterota bacterium]
MRLRERRTNNMAADENKNTVEQEELDNSESAEETDVDEATEKDTEPEEDDLEAQMAAAMAEDSGDDAVDDLEAEMAATMALESEEDDGDLDLEAQMAAAMQEDDMDSIDDALSLGDNRRPGKDIPVKSLEFQQLRPSDEIVESDNIDRLLDVSLNISVELGRKQMQIKEILGLGPGKIIELDKLAGEPVDLLVNGKLLAKGEVVVVDENFGVRITDLINPQDRIKML